jgi:hypothetical protein
VSEDASPLLDLSGTPLESIARLYGMSGDPAVPDAGDPDRPAVRHAVQRVREDSERAGELYAGFDSYLL